MARQPTRARRATASSGRPANRTPSTEPAAAEPSGGGGPSKPAPGLYVVATPIGNLDDVTLRALNVLGSADVVACEDTRTTARLLARHGIRARTTPYHDRNAARARPLLIRRLQRGEVVALVSDAGTPLISDPGYRLVRGAIDAGIAVVPVPGPSAVLAALAAAGLPTDRFIFAGFLPARSAARAAALRDLANIRATLVFLESPRRLAASLADMTAVLGAREAAVARELTKKFEELRRAPLAELAAYYRREGPPRGEVVVVVGPPFARTPVDVDAHLMKSLDRQRLREAVDEVAAATGAPRREVYARALALRGK